jgi:4-hydroxyphenylacetate 3-monooxygenase
MKADVIVGTACLIAEQTRSIVIPEVKQRVAQLMMIRETLNAFILASEAASERTETGLVMPNQAIQNAGRVYASTTYNEMVQILRDVAGGSPAIIPDRRNFENPEIRADIEKYFRVGEVSAEARLRVLNLARELTLTTYAGRTQAYQMFAETPAFAQALALYGTYDRAASMRRAAKLAGLE